MKNLFIVIQIIVLFFILNCKSHSKTETESTEKQNIVTEENQNIVIEENNQNNDPKNTESNSDLNNQKYNKLIVGSWYNFGTATGEDLYFSDDGTYNSRSGDIENEGNWKIEGENLFVFDTEFKIIELSKEKLIIEDKYGQTTYDKMD